MRKKFILHRILIIILMLMISSGAAFPADAAMGQDTGSTDRRRVRVGYFLLPDYQEYDNTTGEYRGYGYDYLNAIAQYADWDYEYVQVSYSEGLNMLCSGQIDLMGNIEQMEKYKGILGFPDLSSGERSSKLIVKDDGSSIAYEDFDAIGKMKIGVLKDDNATDQFMAYCSEHSISPVIKKFNSVRSMDEAMQKGRIDARLTSGLQSYSGKTVAVISTTPYYFAVRKDKPELLKELNSALRSLKSNDPYYQDKIYEKYYGNKTGNEISLTDQEKEYIRENPVVTCSYDPAWYPISYRDENGNFAGPVAKLYSEIAAKTGLIFEFRATDTFVEAIDGFADGKTQMMAEICYDYLWAGKKNARLTPPFTDIMIFGARSPNAGDAGEKTVALPPGYYTQFLSEKILRDGYTFVNYDTVEECLDAALSGKVRYAFLNFYQMEYYRRNGKYRDMQYDVIPGAEYRLANAVSNQADPRLFSIITKAIQSIGTERIDIIFRETNFYGSGKASFSDYLYDNPKIAVLIFSVLGFLAAFFIMMIVNSRVLKKKNLELEKAISIKSGFFSSMSHDMRTPLNGILGFTDMALCTQDEEKRTDCLKKISLSGEVLKTLINDTLDISRLENGKYRLNPQAVEMETLIKGIETSIRPIAERAGIIFTVKKDTDGTKPAMLDILCYEKIFLNLLSNAVKFSKKGGTVEFIITGPDTFPEAPSCNTRFIVRDNGIGMSKEFLPTIFDPFTQENLNRESRTEGTGLGLSIVKNLVALLKGKIDVRSRLGEGTEFKVYLPVDYEDGKPEETKENPGPGSELEGKNILLCDDNRLNVEIAKAILEKGGMNVKCACNGEECIRLFQDSLPGTFSAVILDLRMPVMNGFEAARAIRALDRSDARKIPIFAMSADLYDDDMKRCTEAGMNGQLGKPIEPQKLYHMLEAALQ